MKKNTFILCFFLIAFSCKSFAQCLTKVIAGAYHNVGMKANGTISTWGSGIYGWGALGQGNDSDAITPTQVGTATNWVFVTSGSYNTFAIKANGTLWAAGGNEQGQLGNGTFGNGNVTNSFIAIGTATNWTAIAANFSHTLGLRSNGTLWAWGQNTEGRLGDGTTIDKHIPTQIGTATNWAAITNGIAFSIALKTDGTMWSWGSNSSGCLGIGDLSVYSLPSPVQVGTDTDWQSIASGTKSVHTLAIKNNGTLYSFGGTWGGGQGCLGQGLTDIPNSSPTQIGTDTNWQSVSSGFNNSFGIKTDGTLWGWGQNNVGQLGDGTTVDKGYPTQIGTDTDWSSVTAGEQHTVALKTNGALYSWGDGTYAQLGNGGYTSTLVPTPISVAGCTLGTDAFEEEAVIMSPNPAKDVVLLTLTANAIFNRIEVYDLAGRMVFTTHVMVTGNSVSFAVSDLSSGIYHVVLKDNESVVLVKKLVKE